MFSIFPLALCVCRTTLLRLLTLLWPSRNTPNLEDLNNALLDTSLYSTDNHSGKSVFDAAYLRVLPQSSAVDEESYDDVGVDYGNSGYRSLGYRLQSVLRRRCRLIVSRWVIPALRHLRTLSARFILVTLLLLITSSAATIQTVCRRDASMVYFIESIVVPRLMILFRWIELLTWLTFVAF